MLTILLFVPAFPATETYSAPYSVKKLEAVYPPILTHVWGGEFVVKLKPVKRIVLVNIFGTVQNANPLVDALNVTVAFALIQGNVVEEFSWPIGSIRAGYRMPYRASYMPKAEFNPERTRVEERRISALPYPPRITVTVEEYRRLPGFSVVVREWDEIELRQEARAVRLSLIKIIMRLLGLGS